jgi:hypothetical protein
MVSYDYLNSKKRYGPEFCEVDFVSMCEIAGIIGWHQPYTPNGAKTRNMKGRIVTMFREPRNRIISAFLFSSGLMLPKGFDIKPSHQEERKQIKNHLLNTSHPIVSYASYPGIPSCQTKMVLGYDCGTDIEIKGHGMTEALRRIREDFLFFGLTEEPEATAELFRLTVGGWGYDKDGMTLPSPSVWGSRINSEHNKSSHDFLSRELTEGHWKDVFDEALYAEAAQIFYAKCKQYNITVRGIVNNALGD